MCVVQQNAHELEHRHGGMGVIQLKGGSVGEVTPLSVGASKTSHYVSQGARHQKVLLNEPQTLAHARRIVRIEDAREGLRRQSPRQSLDEITPAELSKVEIIGSRCRPKAECVDRFTAIPDNRA